MNRKKKNLRNKLNVALDQEKAEIELIEDQIDVIESMKALSEKKGQDTEHHDRNIAEKKERLKKVKSDAKLTEKELKKLD